MNVRNGILFGVTWLIAAGAAACGGGGGGTGTGGMGGGGTGGTIAGCETTGTATVSVEISGLPAGVPAAVTFMPAGSGAGASATASGDVVVPAGTYNTVVDNVAAPGAIVRAAYAGTVTGGHFCAAAATPATVTVTYTMIPSSEKVWTGNSNGGTAPFLGFGPTELAASGAPAATVAAMTAGSKGFTFDRDGNAWVLGDTSADPPLARYPAADLGTSGAKTADVEIDSPPFQEGVPGPVALAFDDDGNLWVSVVAAGKVVRFTPAQLAASGTPTPAVVLSGIEAPSGLAFDDAGGLWVASGTGKVLGFGHAKLAASTSLPDISVTAQTPAPVVGDLADPTGLAFDAAGNLWVNFGGTLARLTPTERTGTGDVMVTPAVQIALDVVSLPEGIAFDEDGALWMAYSAGKFGRLTAAQLAASASVTPSTVISSADVGYAGWFALYPAPAALPLYHRLP